MGLIDRLRQALGGGGVGARREPVAEPDPKAPDAPASGDPSAAAGPAGSDPFTPGGEPDPAAPSGDVPLGGQQHPPRGPA